MMVDDGCWSLSYDLRKQVGNFFLDQALVTQRYYRSSVDRLNVVLWPNPRDMILPTAQEMSVMHRSGEC